MRIRPVGHRVRAYPVPYQAIGVAPGRLNPAGKMRGDRRSEATLIQWICDRLAQRIVVAKRARPGDGMTLYGFGQVGIEVGSDIQRGAGSDEADGGSDEAGREQMLRHDSDLVPVIEGARSFSSEQANSLKDTLQVKSSHVKNSSRASGERAMK